MTASLQKMPYLIVAIPQNAKLPEQSLLYNRSIDLDDTLRLVLDSSRSLGPHSLLLIYDGQRGFLYSHPQEILLAYSDSQPAFHEKILSLLRPELMFMPDTFTEIQQIRDVSAAKELHQWIKSLTFKIASVTSIPREQVLVFIHKIIVARIAALTCLNQEIEKRFSRYYIPESALTKARAKLPDAKKDIIAIFTALSEQNNITFLKITPNDILLLRRISQGRMPVQILAELHLLNRHKFTPLVLARYADLEISNSPQKETRESIREISALQVAQRRGKKSYIIEMPTPHYMDLRFISYETVACEIRSAFHETLEVRARIITETKRSAEKVFIQEDLFRHDHHPLYEIRDILDVLITHGIRISAAGELSKSLASFILTASLLVLRHEFQIPTSILPSFDNVFSI